MAGGDVTTNASLFKKKVTSAVYERGCTGVTALAKKTKPPFAEERNINTESSSWQL